MGLTRGFWHGLQDSKVGLLMCGLKYVGPTLGHLEPQAISHSNSNGQATTKTLLTGPHDEDLRYLALETISAMHCGTPMSHSWKLVCLAYCLFLMGYRPTPFKAESTGISILPVSSF